MDEVKWTPEPWALGEDRIVGNVIVAFKGGQLVAKTIYEGGSEDAGRPEANARRIVACVNSCREIDTETLEQFAVKDAVTGFGVAIAERDAARAELLAMPCYSDPNQYDCDRMQARHFCPSCSVKMQAALAAAEQPQEADDAVGG